MAMNYDAQTYDEMVETRRRESRQMHWISPRRPLYGSTRAAHYEHISTSPSSPDPRYDSGVQAGDFTHYDSAGQAGDLADDATTQMELEDDLMEPDRSPHFTNVSPPTYGKVEDQAVVSKRYESTLRAWEAGKTKSPDVPDVNSWAKSSSHTYDTVHEAANESLVIRRGPLGRIKGHQDTIYYGQDYPYALSIRNQVSAPRYTTSVIIDVPRSNRSSVDSIQRGSVVEYVSLQEMGADELSASETALNNAAMTNAVQDVRRDSNTEPMREKRNRAKPSKAEQSFEIGRRRSGRHISAVRVTEAEIRHTKTLGKEEGQRGDEDKTQKSVNKVSKERERLGSSDKGRGKASVTHSVGGITREKAQRTATIQSPRGGRNLQTSGTLKRDRRSPESKSRPKDATSINTQQSSLGGGGGHSKDTATFRTEREDQSGPQAGKVSEMATESATKHYDKSITSKATKKPKGRSGSGDKRQVVVNDATRPIFGSKMVYHVDAGDRRKRGQKDGHKSKPETSSQNQVATDVTETPVWQPHTQTTAGDHHKKSHETTKRQGGAKKKNTGKNEVPVPSTEETLKERKVRKGKVPPKGPSTDRKATRSSFRRGGMQRLSARHSAKGPRTKRRSPGEDRDGYVKVYVNDATRPVFSPPAYILIPKPKERSSFRRGGKQRLSDRHGSAKVHAKVTGNNEKGNKQARKRDRIQTKPEVEDDQNKNIPNGGDHASEIEQVQPKSEKGAGSPTEDRSVGAFRRAAPTRRSNVNRRSHRISRPDKSKKANFLQGFKARFDRVFGTAEQNEDTKQKVDEVKEVTPAEPEEKEQRTADTDMKKDARVDEIRLDNSAVDEHCSGIHKQSSGRLDKGIENEHLVESPDQPSPAALVQTNRQGSISAEPKDDNKHLVESPDQPAPAALVQTNRQGSILAEQKDDNEHLVESPDQSAPAASVEPDRQVHSISAKQKDEAKSTIGRTEAIADVDQLKSVDTKEPVQLAKRRTSTDKGTKAIAKLSFLVKLRMKLSTLGKDKTTKYTDKQDSPEPAHQPEGQTLTNAEKTDTAEADTTVEPVVEPNRKQKSAFADMFLDDEDRDRSDGNKQAEDPKDAEGQTLTNAEKTDTAEADTTIEPEAEPTDNTVPGDSPDAMKPKENLGDAEPIDVAEDVEKAEEEIQPPEQKVPEKEVLMPGNEPAGQPSPKQHSSEKRSIFTKLRDSFKLSGEKTQAEQEQKKGDQDLVPGATEPEHISGEAVINPPVGKDQESTHDQNTSSKAGGMNNLNDTESLGDRNADGRAAEEDAKKNTEPSRQDSFVNRIKSSFKGIRSRSAESPFWDAKLDIQADELAHIDDTRSLQNNSTDDGNLFRDSLNASGEKTQTEEEQKKGDQDLVPSATEPEHISGEAVIDPSVDGKDIVGKDQERISEQNTSSKAGSVNNPNDTESLLDRNADEGAAEEDAKQNTPRRQDSLVKRIKSSFKSKTRSRRTESPFWDTKPDIQADELTHMDHTQSYENNSTGNGHMWSSDVNVAGPEPQIGETPKRDDLALLAGSRIPRRIGPAGGYALKARSISTGNVADGAGLATKVTSKSPDSPEKPVFNKATSTLSISYCPETVAARRAYSSTGEELSTLFVEANGFTSQAAQT